MPTPGLEQILDYARRHGLSSAPEAHITLLSRSFDSALYSIAEAKDAADYVILKYFAPDQTDLARREAEGLRVCGAVGLAPELLSFDDIGATVGGPIVAYREPRARSLGDTRLTDDHVRQWSFLLLTLHHLSAAKVQHNSILSATLTQWWERLQPLWNETRAAYSDPAYAPLIEGLTQLRSYVDVHVQANKDLWVNVPRRPCHGDPIPVNLMDTGERLLLTDWGGFGLGDIAMEIARAAALAALNEEISSDQYVHLMNDYIAGASDLKDSTLEQRVHIYASVFPFGFTLFMLTFLARIQSDGPETTLVEDPAVYRGRGLMAVARSLVWIQDALGLQVVAPNEALAPFGQITIARS